MISHNHRQFMQLCSLFHIDSLCSRSVIGLLYRQFYPHSNSDTEATIPQSSLNSIVGPSFAGSHQQDTKFALAYFVPVIGISVMMSC